MATFITSKAVGETISISVQTSTEYWKYNHDGSDSSVFGFGEQTITVANANGEFTIIPCLSDGTVSGNITQMYLNNNQLTSFDGTGLTNLTYLDLYINQLTSFDGTGLTSLTYLNLNYNQLTSFDGTGLSSLTELFLSNNQLTSFDGTGLSSLTDLYLYNNQLTSFDGTDLSSLTDLQLGGNQFTSFDGTGLSGLTTLGLNTNQLTSFDSTGLSGLTNLDLGGNQLTLFDGTGLSDLTVLNLDSNQLTSFDLTGLTSLIQLTLSSNQLTASVNDQILNQLNQNGLSGIQYLSAEFYSTGGRTSASNADYDNLLNNLNWYFEGLDLIIPPTFITSKAVGETLDFTVTTSTGFWKYNHDGVDSGVYPQNQQPKTVTNANGEFTIISCLSDGTVSGDITYLNLYGNQLTSFDGTGLSSLTTLYLFNNQLTSFDATDLSSLTSLNLNDNQLTSFDGTGLGSLTELGLETNQLTSFDGTGLSSLTSLGLDYNQLTSFDVTGLSGLTSLYLRDNQLTSLDVTGLSSLIELNLYENSVTPSANNQILYQLSQNGLSGGYFASFNGRTSASNADYDNLVSLGWSFEFLDLIVTGSGKLRVKGVNSGGVPTPPWDGGTIYNIGAIVTHEGQTWNCIQYAPAGYGPFGGYIDVYWTL